MQINVKELFLANFSDSDNVRNKISLSLTNFYRPLRCERTQILADIFLYRSLKRTTKRDDTFFQLMLRYTRLISTKRLHKHAGTLVKYYSYSNLVEDISLFNFVNIHLKLAIFLTSN